MVDGKILVPMKSDARFVAMSGIDVVDENTPLSLLSSSRLAKLTLDIFDEDTLIDNSPCHTMDWPNPTLIIVPTTSNTRDRNISNFDTVSYS